MAPPTLAASALAPTSPTSPTSARSTLLYKNNDDYIDVLTNKKLQNKAVLLGERIFHINELLANIGSVRNRLNVKKSTVTQIIEQSVNNLHTIIEKWKNLLITTVSEAIEEKFEQLNDQEIQYQNLCKEMNDLICILNSSSSDNNSNNKVDHQPEDYQDHHEFDMDMDMDDVDINKKNQNEEKVSVSEKKQNKTEKKTGNIDFDDDVSISNHMDKLLASDIDLQPFGLSAMEFSEGVEDIQKGFTRLFRTSARAFDRSMAYVGGIVRGFVRRGNCNLDYVQQLNKYDLHNRVMVPIQKRSDYSRLINKVFPIRDPDPAESQVFIDPLNSARSVWNVLVNLYEHMHDVKLVQEYSNTLEIYYKENMEETEFYLPQLCNVVFLTGESGKSLRNFLLSKCSSSLHFKIQTFFYARSVKDSRKDEIGKRAAELVQQIEDTKTITSDGNIDNFPTQIQFMEDLVDISKCLKSYPSSLYKVKLDEALARMSAQYLENESSLYLPIVRPLGRCVSHKILRAPLEEAFTIPTYGRVLYCMILEVEDDLFDESSSSEEADNDDTYSLYSEPCSSSPTTLNGLCAVSEVKETDDIGLLQDHQSEYFGESARKQSDRIRDSSPFRDCLSWRMKSVLVKYGDQVLQEQFVMQLISQFQRIFIEARLPLKLYPYRIHALTKQSGLIEYIPNIVSLDRLKKNPNYINLATFFLQQFGTSEESFRKAQQNFIYSVAAYSVISYILHIKDRHNGNVLIDSQGNVIHIDFGFILSRTVHFEKAPFRLTEEFVEVMGGVSSRCFKKFRKLCVNGYLAARRHYKKIVMLVEMAYDGGHKVPCLTEGVVSDVIERFHLDWSEEECEGFFLNLIKEAMSDWRTLVFDSYQAVLNDIRP